MQNWKKIYIHLVYNKEFWNIANNFVKIVLNGKYNKKIETIKLKYGFQQKTNKSMSFFLLLYKFYKEKEKITKIKDSILA